MACRYARLRKILMSLPETAAPVTLYQSGCTYPVHYENDQIGKDTHHRIVSFRPEYNTSIYMIGEYLTTEGIDHEISRDELGLLTIYVPMDYGENHL